MAKLVVHDVERTYLVDLAAGESLSVGRSQDCDLPVAAPRASRRHALIGPYGGGHMVRDLDSTNGTTVAGAALAGDRPLGDGDVIDVGGCRIQYWTRP